MHDALLSILGKYGTLPAGFGEALAGIITTENFPAGSLLIREGSLSRRIFFILKGIVRGFYINERGDEVTDWFLKEDQLIALPEGFYFHTPCLNAVQAMENCAVLACAFTDLERLLEQFPGAGRIARKIITANGLALQKRFRGFRHTTVAERYRQLMSDSPDILQRISLKYIASYLNTTRFHLSHIRSQQGHPM